MLDVAQVLCTAYECPKLQEQVQRAQKAGPDEYAEPKDKVSVETVEVSNDVFAGEGALAAYPRTSFPFRNLVLVSIINGNCSICKASKYPLTFPKMTAITSSCTHALRRNVSKVAAERERRRVVMEE